MSGRLPRAPYQNVHPSGQVPGRAHPPAPQTYQQPFGYPHNRHGHTHSQTVMAPSSAHLYQAQHSIQASQLRTQPTAVTRRSNRRVSSDLPTEIWERILSFLYQEDLVTIKRVSRRLMIIAARVDLRFFVAYLTESYFNAHGRAVFQHRAPPDAVGIRWDCSAKDNSTLYRISRIPELARMVRSLVLVTKDLRTNEYLRYAKEALEALPHLRSFRLVVEDWNPQLVEPGMQGCSQELMPILFTHCRYLEELVIPKPMVSWLPEAMVRLPYLKRLACLSELDGYFEQISESVEAKTVIQRAKELQKSARGPVTPGLTDLSFDAPLAAMIPREMRPQIKHLELFNWFNMDRDDIAQFCNVESLTAHQTHTFYSNTPRARPNYQASRNYPQDSVKDDPDEPVPAPVQSLQAFRQGGRTHFHFPKLTSFKWIVPLDLFGPKMCKDIEKFIRCRPKLRRLDLQVLPYGKKYARRILDAMKYLPNLEVLGFEFHDQRFAYDAGMELIAHIPKTVKYLRYTSRGWDLRFRPNSADIIIQCMLDTLPRLKFLHIFDAFCRRDTTPYTYIQKPPSSWNWKNLEFLGIDNAWFDIERIAGGSVRMGQWPPRAVYHFSAVADRKIDEDGEWLMRYHRDNVDYMGAMIVDER